MHIAYIGSGYKNFPVLSDELRAVLSDNPELLPRMTQDAKPGNFS